MAKQKIVYYPPKDEHIEKFAYKACRLLDETYGNGFFTTKNVREFENFLKIVARITAKRLNKGTLQRSKS